MFFGERCVGKKGMKDSKGACKLLAKRSVLRICIRSISIQLLVQGCQSFTTKELRVVHNVLLVGWKHG